MPICTKTHKLIDKDGNEIPPNTEVTDFRGEKMTFLYISRESEPGGLSTGKITVDTENRTFKREFYPYVFGCKIVPR
jgi:hypothetical protein